MVAPGFPPPCPLTPHPHSRCLHLCGWGRPISFPTTALRVLVSRSSRPLSLRHKHFLSSLLSFTSCSAQHLPWFWLPALWSLCSCNRWGPASPLWLLSTIPQCGQCLPTRGSLVAPHIHLLPVFWPSGWWCLHLQPLPTSLPSVRSCLCFKTHLGRRASHALSSSH